MSQKVEITAAAPTVSVDYRDDGRRKRNVVERADKYISSKVTARRPDVSAVIFRRLSSCAMRSAAAGHHVSSLVDPVFLTACHPSLGLLSGAVALMMISRFVQRGRCQRRPLSIYMRPVMAVM